ncbi:MAG: glycosyltransferase family 4 protein [Bacillaceae bacterium]|nr:glycosyltransferase family 4 protein [Bacillaceae bacterium]
MDRPIKVVHIIGGGEYGGAENHIIQLISSFSPQVEASVICFYESAFSEALRKKQIHVEVLDYPRFDPRIAIGLGRVLDQMGPDILHTHGVKANFFGRLLARRRHIKVVTTVHSHLKHDYDRLPIKLLTYLMEYSTRRFSDHFICVSKAIGEDVVRSGVSKDKVSIVPNGIEMERFQALTDRTLIKQELGLSPDAFVVGAVARLRPVKGVHLLIEAAAQLVRDRDDVHVVIIGDGPERPELERRVREQGIADHVHFLGFQQQIERYMYSLDCFVNASLSEGLPLAVLEAMACRVPVVATSVGAVPEMIEHERDGILIEKNSVEAIVEGVRRVLDDPALRSSMVERAYKKVLNHFTTEVMAQQNQHVYHRLMED